jgi:hypothetical protein
LRFLHLKLWRCLLPSSGCRFPILLPTACYDVMESDNSSKRESDVMESDNSSKRASDVMESDNSSKRESDVMESDNSSKRESDAPTNGAAKEYCTRPHARWLQPANMGSNTASSSSKRSDR